MTKSILIAGYGPGISHAVAERFGAAGFSIALVARGADKLAKGVAQLKAKGYTAQAFPADLADLKAVRAVVGKVRRALGPLTVLHWNAAAAVAGDLVTAPAEDLQTVFSVCATSLVAATQEALPDLRQTPEGAVLVTNGGFGLFVDAVDAVAVQGQAMGLSIGNAAKHKTVRVLAKRLEPLNVFVGEVMVLNTVKGTAWDRGQATLEAASIGERFFQLYTARKDHFAQVG